MPPTTDTMKSTTASHRVRRRSNPLRCRPQDNRDRVARAHVVRIIIRVDERRCVSEGDLMNPVERVIRSTRDLTLAVRPLVWIPVQVVRERLAALDGVRPARHPDPSRRMYSSSHVDWRP